ncbi:predicted protein [Arabidopsis lyrata subsp. lyrata]|uniref:Predicted protein n=1 Tax=Arabidopsis lyrata subsp. lyrata TaxID=81972 RepID=D7LQ87_ARALL|nr:protein NEN4 [Arabidopsis lyrata subsp. lyrata]EFH51419.1 predicted protein [Arabidopsis lyrata subsp. lyrata]|eukprot:XP_002875160.1 protein NEN4 [Arabidopsis lyrata subsp. lyrata]
MEMLEGRPVNTLTVVELRKHLSDRNYSTTGKKALLIDRLNEALKTISSEQPEGEQQEEEEGPKPNADRLLFLDLEFEKEDVIEFAVLIVDSKTLEAVYNYETFIKPSDGVVSKFRDRPNGITKAKLQRAPTFLDVHEDIFKVLHGGIWIGHNIIRTDIPLLLKMYRRHNLPEKRIPSFRYKIDTLKWLEGNFLGKTQGLKLNELGKFFKLEEQTHRSLEDCDLNLQVFKLCLCVIGMEKMFDSEESKVVGTSRKSKRLREQQLERW